jgi:hypothetical protein
MMRIAVLAFFGALVVCALGLAGDKYQWKFGTSEDGFTYEFDNFDFTDFTYSETKPDLPNETHNPDEAELKRLRVSWGKPVMGYCDYVSLKTAERKWFESDELHYYRALAIRGRLEIVPEDGKSTKPIDWIQGVRILLARKPNTKPDWSKRSNRDDSVWQDCVIRNDGSFFVNFNPDEIHRPVGGIEPFQVGLVLAKKSGRTVTWTTKAAALPQSVTTVMVSGPKPLSPTMQAINGSPSVMEADFNPVMLIRAVNRLRALGKEKALAELREFHSIARGSRNVLHDPTNIDTSDGECIFLIVRLLFEPADPKDKMPLMGIGAFQPSPKEIDKARWPLFPLALHDDVPFLLGQVYLFASGCPESPLAHVEWAEKHGKLRAKPLRPPDDPIKAADSLMATPEAKRLFKDNDRGDVRRQAWRMIQHLTDRSIDDWNFLPRRKYDADADWADYKRTAAKIKYHWDDKSQAYVGD